MVIRLGFELSPAGCVGVAQWKPRPSDERVAAASPTGNTQILPTCCERQIPATYFSRFDVESYRLCGLVGLIAGGNQPERDAPCAAPRPPYTEEMERRSLLATVSRVQPWMRRALAPWGVERK